MPVTFLTSMFAVMVTVCLITGIWLMAHITALIALFNGKADIVASPSTPRVPRATVILMLTGFGLSLAGILVLQLVALAA